MPACPAKSGNEEQGYGKTVRFDTVTFDMTQSPLPTLWKSTTNACFNTRRFSYGQRDSGNLDLWLAPLLLLPGIGLLIMSTAVRFGLVQTQMIQLSANPSPSSVALAHSLHRRGQFFRLTLSSLYLSTVMFTLSGTINGLNGLLPIPIPQSIIIFISFMGFASLFVATLYLIRESLAATDIITMFNARMDGRLSQEE